MKKLVWISDYPLRGTGFGTVTDEIVHRLKGFYIYVLSLDYNGIPIKTKEGVDILPLSSEAQLEYYMKSLDPDITLVHHSFYFLERLKNIELKGRKIVYIPVEGDPLPLAYKTLLLNFDDVITTSHYSQGVLKRAGVDSRVVYHGVNTEFFYPKKGEWKEVRFGYIGLNDVRKQIPRIMEAYAMLKKGILTIASPNEGHYNLVSEAKSLGISPIFIERKLYGLPLTKNNLRDFYHSLTVYITPSSEGFGLPALESMACGISQIALDHGSSREILGPGALYCPVESFLHSNIGKVGLINTKDLYRKMRFLLEVPEARKKIVEKGIERAKLFPWEKTVTQLEDILNE